MKIFVIGGTNFMGPHVVRMLHKIGHDVTVFHRGKTNCHLPDGVKEMIGDRNEIERYKSEIQLFKPDVVVDMIAVFEQHAKQLVDVFKNIAKRMVVISSADVYRAYEVLTKLTKDELQEVPIKETDALRTVLYPYRGRMETSFAQDYDKIPIEKIVLENSELPGTILRLPMVYGPNDPNRRFAEYIQRMKDNRKMILLDDRLSGWKSTKGYSENVAAAIVTTIENPNSIYQIYNIGDHFVLTELEWVKSIAKLMNWAGEIKVVPAGVLAEELPLETRQDLIMDTTKIRNDLKYQEVVSYEDGMNQTINWEVANLIENPLQLDYEREDEIIHTF